MIELTDNINWNNFLAELKPPRWYKRRLEEGNVDWIKRVAIKAQIGLRKRKKENIIGIGIKSLLNFVFLFYLFCAKTILKRRKWKMT